MRYPTDHKRHTRDRILAAAARLFRQRGYAACGVDAVMSEAGLTPGGFYAHFKDKDDLLAEVFRAWTPQRVRALAATEADPLAAMVDRYLSPAHRDDPAAGCPLPPLAGELPRQSAAARDAFTSAVRAALADIAAHAPGATDAQRTDAAIAVLSTLAGSMLLARSVNDPGLSDRILRATRDHLTQAAPPKSNRSRNA